MRFAIVLLALLLPGCEALNEMVVRQMFIDHGLSGDMNRRIRKRLEKSIEHPPGGTPTTPAPPFLDQG